MAGTRLWRLVLFDRSLHAVELAGGVSSDLVDPNAGIPLARDQLGVAPYMSMLATVIADRHTPLPLSVGIFGEWGSGKSTFMGLPRSQVDALATPQGFRNFRAGRASVPGRLRACW